MRLNLVVPTLALLAAPLAAQGFEGNVSVVIHSDNGNDANITYRIKGTKARIETDMGGARGGRGGRGMLGGAVVIDQTAKTMTVLIDAQQMAMQMTMPDLTGMAAGRMGRGGQMPANPPKVTRTGKTETVAGHVCEHVTVASDTETADVCIAKDVNAAFMLPGMSPMRGDAGQPGWASGLGGGFPLKVSVNDRVALEVTSIEAKTLDASLFEVPSNYRVMDMSGMRRP